MKPTFFATPAALRAWYEAHHADAPELWLGFHKVGTGKPSVTYQQALDEALCWGWIDGVRRGGKEDWAIRFLPRVRKANWSAQPASYQKPAAWWVVSAKKPETKARRLAQLVADSAQGRRVGRFIPPQEREPASSPRAPRAGRGTPGRRAAPRRARTRGRRTT
ncbi:MAG: YdeI/OmpD-associated family protein [Halobacteriales archaeon]|nr:YdeI/OmpD-associated family protein [Halobacteriales archaeon]